jgi:hypothetical protein
MNTLTVFDYEATHGMQIIIDIHEAVETARRKAEKEAAATPANTEPKAMASPVEALAKRTCRKVHEIKKFLAAYKKLGPPNIQRAAKQAQLSLSVVMDLSDAIYPLRNFKNRTQLIVKLCGMLEGLTADEAKALMVDTVKEWSGDSSKRADTACMHKRVGIDGKRRFVAVVSAPIAARIDTVLHHLAEQIRKNEPELQYDQACAKAFIQKMLGTTTGEQSAQFGPMFMISTDHHFHSDGKVTTTDGALVNLSDLVDEKLARTGWAAVTGTTDDSPVIKLVGAFVKVRSRFASPPQRLAAIIENLACTWPECDIPASKCQIHHIKAHKHGGQTTGVNLVPLCKKHNGMNDDNPGQRTNGRIERDPQTGRPGLQLAPGAPLMFNNHPTAGKTITAFDQQNKLKR